MSNKVSVNYYSLRGATLFPESVHLGAANVPDRTLDIASMIPRIDIHESVGSQMLMGTVEVYDSIGLLEAYPLRGEERLQLEISDSMNNLRIWDLFVYKIDNVKTQAVNKLVTYTMHFITYQSFLANTRIITQAFKNKKISEIAKEIFDESYNPTNDNLKSVSSKANSFNETFDGTKKDLVLEGTEGNVRLVIPRMTTQQAMDFLVRRSYSGFSPSCSFRFFESSDSFFFVSDEYLYERANTESRTFTFTFYDKIARDGMEFLQEINNLDTVKNSHRVNSLDDIHGGAYRNRVLEVDSMKRIANIKDEGYDYMKVRGQYFPNTADTNLVDRHTDEFVEAYARVDNARRYILSRDYSETADVSSYELAGERHYKDIIQNKLPFLKHLTSIAIEASGPPRLDIAIGDIIDLEIYKLAADTSSESIPINKQLSGKYLVLGLTRTFNLEEGRNIYTMVKMNWNEGDSSTTSISNKVTSFTNLKRRLGL